MRVTRPRVVIASAFAGALVIAGVVSTFANAATTGIPIGQTMTGKATYYNDAGYGACGTAINAATESLVAVSHTWWTTANPNNDPLCRNVSVQVTYNGKTIVVPVKDKCPSCDSTHLDLSQAAFGQFASTDPANTPGVLTGVVWKFVNSDGTGATPPATPTTATPTTAAPTKTTPTPTTPAPTTAAPTKTTPTTTPTRTGSPTTPPTTPPTATPTGPRTGTITGMADKCIGAAHGKTSNGTAIDLYSCVNEKTQRWTLPGDGTIRVSGKCMDVARSGTSNGTVVQVYTCNGTAAQQWVRTGDQTLVNPHSNKCLTLAGDSSADFTRTQIRTCTGATSQKWTIPTGTGS
jgi:hypothetical protein